MQEKVTELQWNFTFDDSGPINSGHLQVKIYWMWTWWKFKHPNIKFIFDFQTARALSTVQHSIYQTTALGKITKIASFEAQHPLWLHASGIVTSDDLLSADFTDC